MHQSEIDSCAERIWRRFRRDQPLGVYRNMIVEELRSYQAPDASLTPDPASWPSYKTSAAVRQLHAAFMVNKKRNAELVARVGNLDDARPPRPLLRLRSHT